MRLAESDYGIDFLSTPETRPQIPPGELWVYPHNLKTAPLQHDLVLHPYAKCPLNVPIPEELRAFFNSPDFDSEVSTRSALAQSKIHTSFTYNGNGILKYTAENNGAATFIAPKGHELQVGAAFFHKEPLEYDETEAIRAQIVTEGEPIEIRAAGEIEGVDTAVILVPIETEHPQMSIPDPINLTELPGGPQRQRLHLLNGVDPEGVKRGAPHNGIETYIKLGATAKHVLPPNTALRIIYGYNAHTGELIGHEPSDLLLSQDLKEGKPVTHTIITETEGEVPTHVICEVFNSVRMEVI